MAEKPVILTVGANPAWQKALHFARFEYGRVNRADAMLAFASGKGVNFCRAAGIWGKAKPELLQFVGGDNGKLLLDDLARERLSAHSIASDSPTRCCTTCLSEADGTMTELIEPSRGPGAAAEQQALEYLAKQLPRAAGLALCGQLPSGMDVAFYVECTKLAAANRVPVLIDSWQKIAPVLETARQVTLKINTDELAALTGIAEVRTAMKTLFNAYDLERIAITAGPGIAYLGTRDHFFQFATPRLDKVVNPVGSGDTTSAVFWSELMTGTAAPEAFARALAAASANCLSLKCGEFELSDAWSLREKISMID